MPTTIPSLLECRLPNGVVGITQHSIDLGLLDDRTRRAEDLPAPGSSGDQPDGSGGRTEGGEDLRRYFDAAHRGRRVTVLHFATELEALVCQLCRTRNGAALQGDKGQIHHRRPLAHTRSRLTPQHMTLFEERLGALQLAGSSGLLPELVQHKRDAPRICKLT